MSESAPLIIDQASVGDGALLSRVSLLSSEPFDENDFVNATEKDAKAMYATMIPATKSQKETTMMLEKLFANTTREELYSYLTSTNFHTHLQQLLDDITRMERLKVSIQNAKAFTPRTPALENTDLVAWKRAAGTSSGITTKDKSRTEVQYVFPFDKPQSLFLAILFAAPELLNDLILDFRPVDVNKAEFVSSEAVANANDAFLEKLNDPTASSDDALLALATASMLSLGKLVEVMSDVFDTLHIEGGDTRDIYASFAMELLSRGLSVNDDKVWGRVDKVIRGTRILFDPNAKLLKVVCDKVYVSKYSDAAFFQEWLPSSFYYGFDIHGRSLKKPVYRTEKDFWKRVVLDRHRANQSPKNIFCYIQSRLR